MSLYGNGTTVNMTNNSAAVVGVGTAFVANVTAGDGFLIPGETVYYTVLSITDDTHLTLSVVYAGVTGNGKTYQISRDWTVNLGLAEIQPGDPNWPYLLTQKVIRLIDAGVQSVLTNSAGLAAALGDETGTGLVVFNNSPSLITPKSTTTIGVGNATPAASGAGITFPATQSASTDPNTLDDYEEGNVTLGVSFGGGITGITYWAGSGGYYTRIGNLVTVTGYMELTNKGSSTGSAKITGLPFAVVNANAAYSIPSMELNAITFANQYAGVTDVNATTISLHELTEAGTRTDLTDADFVNYSSVTLTITYRAQ